MPSLPEVPERLWRLLGRAAVALLVGLTLTIALISRGTFDPAPVGEPREVLTLSNVSFPAGAGDLTWLPGEPDGNSFTAQLTASAKNGARFGLAFGSQEEAVVLAVDPAAGYVALWRHISGEESALMPWQTWPHVRPQAAENELWLDIMDGSVVAARVNGELMWRGALPLGGTTAGLWSAAPGGPSDLQLGVLRLYGD
jgi:hypothetical protein